jgi:hypothetical protein
MSEVLEVSFARKSVISKQYLVAVLKFHSMKMYDEVEIRLHELLTSASHEGK